MQALKDYIIARLLPRILTTASGLYIPETAPEHVHRYTVLSAGPECVDVKAGDTVAMAEGGRRRLIEIGDDKFYRLKETDLLYIETHEVDSRMGIL